MFECHLNIEEALPLVCLCSLLSFLCGVGIGGNDLSANFAMVVGSGALDMKAAIWYCVVFELLGAFFMGGKVSGTIRNGILSPELLQRSPDMVVGGMTAATFSSALWLYLSTVFGLPVSITHTVVGSVLGFGIFSVGSFEYINTSMIGKIAVSWLAAPLFSALATALVFWVLKEHVLKGKGCLQRTARTLPLCMLLSIFVDVGFVFIEQPPLLQNTLNKYFPAPVPLFVVSSAVFLIAAWADRYVFPDTIAAAKQQTAFCWESEILTTLPVSAVSQSDAWGESGATVNHSALHALSGGQNSHSARHDVMLSDVASVTSSDALGRSGVYRLSSMNPTDPLHQQHDVKVVAVSSGAAANLVKRNKCVSDSVVKPSLKTPPLHPEDDPLCEENFHLAEKKKHVSYGAVSMVEFDEQSPRATSSERAEEDGEEIAEQMAAIHYGDVEVRHFNPRAEALFTVLQVLAGAMSSFVHGAVAGANATATFMILYETFATHYLAPSALLQETGGKKDAIASNFGVTVFSLSGRWSIFPAMFGITIGMFSLGSRLMKTVGVDLVTVTPVRGWSMQLGGTLVTMLCTAVGIPVSLSQCQIGAAIGCGITDAGGSLSGVSWRVVLKIIAGWIVTLLIGSLTTGLVMRMLAHYYCGLQFGPPPTAPS